MEYWKNIYEFEGIYEASSFCVQYDAEETSWLPLYTICDTSKYERVGNIFDNPDYFK